MKRITHNEYLAAKDAYLARLLAIVDCMIAEEDAQRNTTKPQAISGDPLGASPSAQLQGGDSLAGTLNANLHPCMLPFEDFVCDIGHKSHPFCD